ncbi:GOLPH3/VPS74 family protein [Streptomyces orinoci]|uniref:GPP34 family phosphoprotein n=1 Tax=Streptomyces orinoci TaxID=67339 RepID=A0ABV3K5M6_STRON|nr:GPP34 family phosphoprotein [Streptomyces orinoci]
MTTPRDLMIIAMDVAPSRPVEQGEMSLALAGAELVELLGAGAVTLRDDRIVPGGAMVPGDRLLEQAAGSLVREEPYESVEDWLWRRGRDLAPAYLAALEGEGLVKRQGHGWMPLREGRVALVDSSDRRRAADRWAADEPVLLALATAVGIRDEGAGDTPEVADEEVEAVLAVVVGAVVELEGVRQRRAIEQEAFDNIWRVP